MENKKKALGRGLEQLFNSENLDVETIERQIYETSNAEEIIEVDLNELRPNPYQPRKTFNDETLNELADSIKEHGVFQPIIIKKSIKGYEIIAGERRVRASRIAGLTKIPAIIRPFTDEQMMEIALLENLQRENLNIIDEASAYKTMIDNLNLTQDELARKIGKSRSHVTNVLGLLRLPKPVQNLVALDKISMGHARVLSKLEDETVIISLATKIIEENLAVRELEQITSNETFERKNKIIRPKIINEELRHVEDMLREKLDAKVRIKDRKIEISYTNIADLNRILEIIDIKD